MSMIIDSQIYDSENQMVLNMVLVLALLGKSKNLRIWRWRSPENQKSYTVGSDLGERQKIGPAPKPWL